MLWIGRHPLYIGPVHFAETTSRSTIPVNLLWEKNTVPTEKKTSWKVRIIKETNRARTAGLSITRTSIHRGWDWEKKLRTNIGRINEFVSWAINLGAIAFLSLFWTPIVILPLFSSTLCFYLYFFKMKVQFTPTLWIACNGVKKVDWWQVCPSEYCVFAPISNPNYDFTPTFFHFVFLPLLFQNEGSVYPNS